MGSKDPVRPDREQGIIEGHHGPGPAAQSSSLMPDVSPSSDPGVYPIRFNALSRRGDLTNMTIIQLP